MKKVNRVLTLIILLSITIVGEWASSAGAPSDALNLATDKEVCSGVTSLGKKLREFEKNFLAEIAKSDIQRSKITENAKTEEEKRSISRKEAERFLRWYDDIENEFNDIFLPEIKAFRGELLKRLRRQEPLPKSMWSTYLGSITAANQFSETAAYLEKLGWMLCPETPQASH